MLSAIVQKATSERLVDYMKPRFFDPLGIANPVWDQSPEDVSLGGSGLCVTTEDILRFGQVYLQRGVWKGRQILPESWITEATSLQASTPPNDSIRGWGYNFIIYPDQQAYGSGGQFGQTCIILPKTNSVVAITAGVRRDQMQAIDRLVWKHLLPAMGESGLPEADSAFAVLKEKLRNLSLPVPQGKAEATSASTVSSRSYVFLKNDRGLTSLTLEPTLNGNRLSISNGKGVHQIDLGDGVWTAGRTSFEPPSLVTLGVTHDGSEVPCAASGAWISDDTFSAKLCYTESPFIETITLKFDSNRVILTR